MHYRLQPALVFTTVVLPQRCERLACHKDDNSWLKCPEWFRQILVCAWLHDCCAPHVTKAIMACRLGPQAVIKTYKGAEHTEILSNDAAVADLLDILTEDFTYKASFSNLLKGLWGSLSTYRGSGQFQ